MDINAFLEHVLSFESRIQDCIGTFKESFGVPDPSRLWRQGKIPRTGKLGEKGIEYSLHGSGCTFNLDGQIISFDFDGEESFVYSPFKLVSFVDDESLTLKDAEVFFEELNVAGNLHVVEGKGLRLVGKSDR